VMAEDGDFLENILLNSAEGFVAGIDDITIPSTQGSEIQVDEVQASRSTKGGPRRTKNFHYKEDEVICKGWLSVSKDPINGANQSRTTFWGKVHAYYEENNDSALPRTESSIMHRWLTIQMQVNKFCSHYEAILRRNQSGTTIQDKLNEAKKMYVDLDKDHKTFTLEHCWAILKGEDKWRANMIELAEIEKLAASKKNKKAGKVSRPRDEGVTNNDQVIPVDDEETQPRKRSDGIKKAKEKMRQGGGQACIEAFNMMWAKKEAADKEKEKTKEERFMQTLEIEKATLHLEQKRVENEAELQKKRVENETKLADATLIKEEKDIMLADMTSLNPTQRSWIEIMQKKILAKHQES